MSTRRNDYTIPGARKSLIPEVAIRDGVFRATGEPRWNIDYRFHYTGMYAPCHSLEEAFKWLEHYAEEDGFKLSECVWKKDSQYNLFDRSGVVQPTLF